MTYLFVLLLLLSGVSCTHLGNDRIELSWPEKTLYNYKEINGYKMFYRQAGNSEKPAVLLLHGYPSSSHTYRELIPMLSGRYHVIAPDNLGSGLSDRPDPKKVKVTFDLLAEQITDLLTELKIKTYYIYMQDFGAPVGFRLMLSNPEKVRGLIAQNANAYMAGLSEEKKKFFLTAGDSNSKFPVSKLQGHVSREAIINSQYLRDVPKEKQHIMSPDTWTHDLAFLKTQRDKDIQISLFRDYRANLSAYPKWQSFLKKSKPPTLIVWGKHDPVFMWPGAKAYLEDLPEAELHLLDAGHFALEEKPVQIAKLVLKFLDAQQTKD